MKKLIFSITAVAVLLVLAVPALAANWNGPEEMLDAKAEILQQRVEEGIISQEEADEVMEALEERAANCVGSPKADRERLGQTIARGLGFGRTEPRGEGKGPGNGFGHGGNR